MRGQLGTVTLVPLKMGPMTGKIEMSVPSGTYCRQAESLPLITTSMRIRSSLRRSNPTLFSLCH